MTNIVKFFSLHLLNYSLFILCISVFNFFACHRDVIDPGLDELGEQFVIEGVITDTTPYYNIVKVSQSRKYTELPFFDPVSEAIVTISDNEGRSEILYESAAGIYRTRSLHGFPERTYTLDVDIKGQIFSAVSTMPNAMQLDSAACIQETNMWYTDYYLRCYFQDRPDVEEYCRFKIYRNNELFTGEYHLYQDRTSDGQYIIADFFEEISFKRDDHVKVELITIDKMTYNYFSTLNDILDTQDDDDEDFGTIIFPMTIYNPTTNVTNNALGYFSACTVREYRFVVE